MLDNEKMIQKQLKFLYEEDDVFEVCVIRPSKKFSELWHRKPVKTLATGCFKDRTKATKIVLQCDKQTKPEGVYISLNPYGEEMLNGKLIANSNRPKDEKVSCIRNLLIDIDPVRPSGHSASNEEHKAALNFGKKIMRELNWPKPMVVDSGNGVHLIYKVKLGNALDDRDLVRNVLKALAEKYDTENVKVDTSVYNPSRLIRAGGTMNRKGKVHRVARLLLVPKQPQILKRTQLEALAKVETPKSQNKSNLDIGKYLQDYKIKVVGTKRNGNSTMYLLEKCLFDPMDKPKEAAIVQGDNALLSYFCFHNSCKNYRWEDARRIISGDARLDEFVLGTTKESRPRIEIVTATDMIASEVENPPVIKGLLGQRESLLVYGASGIGKSILSLDVAVALARSDTLWNIFPIPKPVKTFFIQSENGYHSMSKRLSGMIHGKTELRKAMDDLYFPKLGDDCRLMGDLLEKEFVWQLQDLMVSSGAGLLVLDPLITYHCGNENDNSEMRKSLDALTKLCEDANVAVLVIHHAGKGGTFAKARGASAITDWASNILSLDREEGKEILKVKHEKSRNFERHKDFYLKPTGNFQFERTFVKDEELEIIKEIVEKEKTLSQGKLKVLIAKRMKRSESKAYRLIQKGVKNGIIKEESKGNVKMYKPTWK